MNKAKLIARIEHELVQADEATTDAMFEKHMYAIHILTSLYAETTTTHEPSTTMTKMTAHTSNKQVTPEEIKMMGGNVSSTSTSHVPESQRMKTDDELGNGASIFDF